MKKLGDLQATVWDRIKKATHDGDGASLRVLGAIADEMDRQYDSWNKLLANGRDANDAIVPKDLPDLSENPVPGDGDSGRNREDFSGRSIRAFELGGRTVPVGSYKDLLLGVIKTLQEQDFDRLEALAPKIRGRGPYFSQRADELRLPHKLAKGKFFVETNLNANLIVDISRRLAHAFGQNLKLDVVPFRTRLHRGGSGYPEA